MLSSSASLVVSSSALRSACSRRCAMHSAGAAARFSFAAASVAASAAPRAAVASVRRSTVLLPLPSHSRWISSSSSFAAAAAAAASASSAPSAAPAAAAAAVDPPRLVYELADPPSTRLYAAITGTSSVFWAYIWYMGMTNPEVPLWWGGVGLGTTIAFLSALRMRSARMISEIAVYSASPDTFRIQTSTLTGKHKFADVSLHTIGPNPNPALTKRTPKYWPIKIGERAGYFLLDRDGDIYDLHSFNRFLGYDVRSSVNAADAHLVRLAKSARQQANDERFAPRGNPPPPPPARPASAQKSPHAKR